MSYFEILSSTRLARSAGVIFFPADSTDSADSVVLVVKLSARLERSAGVNFLFPDFADEVVLVEKLSVRLERAAELIFFSADSADDKK